MTDDGAGLLAAVLANPADDTVRLVLADWLTENGQAERAEFIRVQIALAKYARDEAEHNERRKSHPHMLPYGGNCDCSRLLKEQRPCPFCRARDREEELWNYGAPGHWAVDDPFPFDHCIRCIDDETISKSLTTHDPIAIYRRGFVDQITCSAADWMRFAADIVSAHPVTEIRLSDKEPQEGQFGEQEGNPDWELAGKPYWLWRSGLSGEAAHPWAIPHDIWCHLKDSVTPQRFNFRQYLIRAAATQAVSAACLAFAHEQARRRGAA